MNINNFYTTGLYEIMRPMVSTSVSFYVQNSRMSKEVKNILLLKNGTREAHDKSQDNLCIF
jgi:hypothetical protein